jgi:hypothetical protein
MSNGSTGGAIKATLEFLAGAIGAGGKTRKELLASASQMASAIQMASAMCTSRLAGALAASTVAEKRQILAKLTNDEILQMGHLNKLCDPIGAAANQLDHALSAEWANVNLGSHGLARHAFKKLQDREWGLQQLFNETIAAQVPDAELDEWMRKKIGELLEMGTAATKLVSALTAAI